MRSILEKDEKGIEEFKKDYEAYNKSLSTPLNKHGMTLLDFAVKHSDGSTVKFLVKDTNVNILEHMDEDQLHPVHYASKDARHHDKMCALLKIFPELINHQCGKERKTPLHYAIEKDCHKNIDFLLKQANADVTIVDTKCKNILHYIISKKSNAASKYKDILKKILKHMTFKPSALSCNGGETKSVIDYAVDKDCMIVLLEIGKSKS